MIKIFLTSTRDKREHHLKEQETKVIYHPIIYSNVISRRIIRDCDVVLR